MKKMLCLAALALVSAALADETAPQPAASVEEAVGAVVRVLQRNGLPFQTKAVRDAAVSAVVKAVDPSGRLLSAAEKLELEEARRGLAYEIALNVSVSNKAVQIDDVPAGTPAADAGLQAGETIEQIDGGDATELRLWEIRELLRGPRDVSVKFKVRGTNNAPRDVELKRSPVELKAIRGAEELGMGLCHLKLNGLFPGSGKEIVSVLRGWSASGRVGVVLDLRGAGGGDTAAAAEVASLFASPGALLFSFRNSQDQDLDVRKAAPGAPLNTPAMILTDERTEGASEVLAAALAGSARGVMLIGTSTRGDPLVRDTVNLPDGQQLYVVTKRLLVADGKSYDGREGVRPDILVDTAMAAAEEYVPEPVLGAKAELTEEEKEAHKLRERINGDTTLRRAVDVLLGLKALNIRGGYSQNMAR